MKNNNSNLQIQINKESTINSLQKEFNAYYPFLKISFFKQYFKGEPLPKELLLSDAELLKKLDANYCGNIINIDKTKTVSQLEENLGDLFGLSVLVFRKSGNVWVETSLTEDWTLEKQNKEGEQISYHFH